MESFIIKTNNSKIIDFLQTELNKGKLENIKFSSKKFRIYKNVIIHYNGKNKKQFLYKLACILANCIEKFYEKDILKSYINYNYFYFEEYERDIILRISFKIIEIQKKEFEYKTEILKELLYDYLMESNTVILDGIVNFRIKEYKEILSYVAEIAIENYLRLL